MKISTKILLIFIFCLLAGGMPAAAQVSSLPLDSVTHKVTYQGVVRVLGASQAELHNRAREWFATSFGSAKAVVEVDDRRAGKLIGNASSTFFMTGAVGAATPMRVWRRIQVEVKDGRCHYTFTDFTLGNEQQAQTEASSLERWLTPTRATFNNDGSPKAVTVSVFEGVRSSSESQASSLRAAMIKPVRKSDW